MLNKLTNGRSCLERGYELVNISVSESVFYPYWSEERSSLG
jgi:hypothetical protein